MAININAKTTGVGGLETSADNSGNINIQSGGTTVMSVTSSGVAVTGSFSQNGAVYSTQPTFRNLIINGDMRIDQRNAGASVTPSAGNTYTLDRWLASANQASKFTVQQNAASITPPSSFKYYLGATSSSAYSVLTGDYLNIQQRPEGFNVNHLGWGTSAAKTVTLSFWVRSSLTGTFGGAIKDNTNNYSYPYSYTISSANTWEQKSITIAGPTAGSWSSTTGIGMQVLWSLGAGATYSGTAGSWSANDYRSVTGATSVVGTSGATFYITGVQLEVGSTATDFENLPYDVQLARCQRYYYRNSADSNYMSYASGRANSTTVGVFTYNHPVTMRASPTYTQSGTGVNTPSQITTTSLGTIYAGKNSSFVTVNVASGLTAGYGLLWNSNNNTTSYVEANAEL